MAEQQPSVPSGFPVTQQQAMINQQGSSQTRSELMGPQQGSMSSGLVNPQQFGTRINSNVGVIGLNPSTQKLISQRCQQLAQRAFKQLRVQQIKQMIIQQKQQQQTALTPQSSQAITQVQTPCEPDPQVQMQSQQRIPEYRQQSQEQQSKEYISIISLCEIGQKTIHDITHVTLDIFKNLHTIEPPDGTQQGYNLATEKKNQILTSLNQRLPKLFKYLRQVYDTFNEHCKLLSIEYTHIESLIPLNGTWDIKFDEKKTSEVYRHACKERNELIKQLIKKNRQLKEIIDHLRLIISEMSIMLHMQRT